MMWLSAPPFLPLVEVPQLLTLFSDGRNSHRPSTCRLPAELLSSPQRPSLSGRTLCPLATLTGMAYRTFTFIRCSRRGKPATSGPSPVPSLRHEASRRNHDRIQYRRDRRFFSRSCFDRGLSAHPHSSQPYCGTPGF